MIKNHTGEKKPTFISSVFGSPIEEYYLGKSSWSAVASDWKQRFEVGDAINDPAGDWDPSTAEAYIDSQIEIEANTRLTQDTYLQSQLNIIKKNKIYLTGTTLSSSMISQANTIYVVKDDLTLAEDITIPANCILEFDGGSISANGSADTITGTNCIIRGEKALLNGVIIGTGVSFYKDVVPTSIFKTWNAKCFKSICNLCMNGGTVLFDANFTYTTDEPVVLSKSFNIEGNGNEISITNGNLRVMNFLTISNADQFTLKNLNVNGRASNSSYNTYTNERFITIDTVSDVTIDGCVFHNINGDCNDWVLGKNGYYFIGIYRYKHVSFKYNRIYDVMAPEGLLLYPDELEHLIPMEEYYPTEQYVVPVKRFVDIEEHLDRYSEVTNMAEVIGNSFSWNYTSSNIDLFFGRIILENNIFHTVVGTSINCFCHNSVIKNNVFTTVMRKTSIIDFTEQSVFNFFASDVEVSGNKAGRCGYFVEGSKVKNISITNNYCDTSDEDKDDCYEEYKDTYPFVGGRAFYFSTSAENIEISYNYLKGFIGILDIVTDNLENVKIANNTFNTSNSFPLSLTQGKNISIINNMFVGGKYNSDNRFYNANTNVFVFLMSTNAGYQYENVEIIGNNFIAINNNISTPVLVDIYDASLITSGGHFPDVTNLKIVGNYCNTDVLLNIATDNADTFYTDNMPVKIKDNRFNVKGFSTNVNTDTDVAIGNGKEVVLNETDKNGYLVYWHIGVYIPKGSNFYGKQSPSDTSVILRKATVNGYSAAKQAPYGSNIYAGSTIIHGNYMYYVLKGANSIADFTDAARIPELGLIRMGEIGNFLNDFEHFPPLLRESNGPTGRRPTLTTNQSGTIYFDNDLGKPLWWCVNTTHPNGAWVDASGNTPT